MLSLIIHADDFGLSEKVNAGILAAHLHGILTSTSVIANGASFEHAVTICKASPSLDVGVHLTLVEERPILSPHLIPSLVNRTGRFHNHATEFTKRYLTSRIRLAEVRTELEAQIGKVLETGLEVSHLDSHQHLHMLPQIRRITVELAKEYSIPAIRVPNEKVRPYMLRELRLVPRILHLFILKALSQREIGSNTIQPDYFLGFVFSGKLNKRNLKKILVQLPDNGTCELMCHPGVHDPNTNYSHWNYHWADELDALTDAELIDFIQNKGIDLISYRHLIRS